MEGDGLDILKKKANLRMKRNKQDVGCEKWKMKRKHSQ